MKISIITDHNGALVGTIQGHDLSVKRGRHGGRGISWPGAEDPSCGDSRGVGEADQCRRVPREACAAHSEEVAALLDSKLRSLTPCEYLEPAPATNKKRHRRSGVFGCRVVEAGVGLYF
jgi:hypothetical protein